MPSAAETEIRELDCCFTIRWKERRISQVNALVETLLRRFLIFNHPFPDVTIPFAAVTSNAGRNDICWFSDASLRDRYDMVPRFGVGRTISAASLEIFEQNFFGKFRHSLDASLSPLCVLAPGFSMIAVVGVTLAIFAIDAYSAGALLCYLGFWKPIFTSSTPAQTHLRLLFANTIARSRHITKFVPAIGADIATPILSRSIDFEFNKREHSPARCTGLHLGNLSIGGSFKGLTFDHMRSLSRSGHSHNFEDVRFAYHTKSRAAFTGAAS